MAFGPLTAFADNLSGLNCTANDVRILGAGPDLNEPCTCSGTFTADVRFRDRQQHGDGSLLRDHAPVCGR